MACCQLEFHRRIAGVMLLGMQIALFALASAIPAAAQTATTEALTRESTLIFAGTVEKVGASTMPAVKATETTAIVRVDQVIASPGAPPGLAGKAITVRLLNLASIKPEARAVFFTKGWLLGKSMAVVEVGRLPGNTDVKELSAQISQARQKVADEDLQAELATTEAVVVGRVTSVYAAKIPRLLSEHDPDWYVAIVQVESVMKGQLAGREVSVLFPHSDDVQWKKSPKFKEGQRGVWLLHRNQARLVGAENQLTALRALDFRPREEVTRMERLVKASQ